MKITVTKKYEAEISECEAKRIAIKCIRDAVKWVDHNYVEDGQLWLDETYHTSHSWTDHLVVREATEADLAAHTIIASILKS